MSTGKNLAGDMRSGFAGRRVTKDNRGTAGKLLIALMAVNAAVFFVGAVLHSGISLGPLHEPHIFPATVVEIICGVALVWGVTRLVIRGGSALAAAITANLVALAGVMLGIIAPAVRAHAGWHINPDHRIMLVLIGASLLAILARKEGRLGSDA